MNFEVLKNLFGTNEDGTPKALTGDEFIAKLEEATDIKLANLSDGGYVSKDKYDAKNTELTGIKTQLEDANKTIQSYKDMDIESIKQSAADWEKKANDARADLEQRLAEQAREYSTELFLKNYQFSSKAAEKGIRSEFEAKGFTLENGKFLGAEEYMKDLMENDDYKAAFVTSAPVPDPTPAPEPTPAPNHPQWAAPKHDPNTPPKKKSLLELMKEKNENPNMVIDFD